MSLPTRRRLAGFRAVLLVVALARALTAAEPARPSATAEALIARLRALAAHAADFGPAYEPLYRAALPWYEQFGANPPHAVDGWMVPPDVYAAELARALEHGQNTFAVPNALLPLVFSATRPDGRELRTNYWLVLPEHFGEEGRTFPLIISLHGSGWLGHKISFVRQTRGGAPRGPFLQVTPINEAGPWSIPDLNAYLDELLRILPVDRDRVYVQGHSLGAIATWEWALQNPDRFAALCPQGGIGQPFRAPRLRDVPVWVIHGADDDVLPSGFSDQMVSALQDCGGRVRYSRLQQVPHNMPADLDHAQIADWYLRQTRSQAPAPADPLAAITFDEHGSSAREILTIPAGRFWKSGGVDVADRGALTRAAGVLFRQIQAAADLVDAPMWLRRDLQDGTTQVWVAAARSLRREAPAPAGTIALPERRCVRFYLRGPLTGRLAQLDAIVAELKASGHPPGDTVWIMPVTFQPDAPDFVAEYRVELR